MKVKAQDQQSTARHLMEGALMIAALGFALAALSRRQMLTLESTLEAHVHAICEDIRSYVIPEKGDAAFHWEQLLEMLPRDMEALGLTERQSQVSLGIIQHKTYDQIAHEVRLDERTVRQHATYAFQKVGCSKKSEFLGALMACIQKRR